MKNGKGNWLRTLVKSRIHELVEQQLEELPSFFCSRIQKSGIVPLLLDDLENKKGNLMKSVGADMVKMAKHVVQIG